jgi:hypothetical protein
MFFFTVQLKEKHLRKQVQLLRVQNAELEAAGTQYEDEISSKGVYVVILIVLCDYG